MRIKMEISNKKKTFISYLDDDGQKVEGYVISVKIEDNFVVIENDKNIIKIPSHRLLKIKELKVVNE